MGCRRGGKRVLGSRSPMLRALRANPCWSLAFVSAIFGAKWKFRIHALDDDCAFENLWLIATTRISDASVAWHLDALVTVCCKHAASSLTKCH